MTRTLQRYAATGALVVALVILALWPFLESPARQGLLWAAAIALPVQVTAFGLLIRHRTHVNRFLAIWAGGTLVRMVVVALVAFVAIRVDVPGAVPMSLALAGFFYGLLLLEPVYFRLEPGEKVEVS